jgi:serine/threonine-protein kinase
VLIGVLALASGLLAVRSWWPWPARAPGAAAPSAEPVESPAPYSVPESEPSAPLPTASPLPGIATPSPAASARPDSPPAPSAGQVPAAPPAVTPRPPPQPAASGTLLLLIVPESEVTIDGDSIGAVSNREVALAAGPHAVLILHPEYKPLPRKVTILPGAVTRLIVDLKEKGIRQQP